MKCKITVIAPSSITVRLGNSMRPKKERVEKEEYVIHNSEYLEECNDFYTASIQSRVDDLHQAFLDCELIAKHLKVLCEYSDIQNY